MSDDKYLRLMAEFDNYKKRTKLEIELMEKDIQYNALSKFIDILDDWTFFEKVVTESNNNDIKTGFGLIDRKINSFLSSSDIEEIQTDVYDINLHEAVSHIESSKKSGDIVNVISKGYKMGDKIMKYPKVIVQK